MKMREAGSSDTQYKFYANTNGLLSEEETFRISNLQVSVFSIFLEVKRVDSSRFAIVSELFHNFSADKLEQQTQSSPHSLF